MKAQIKYLLLIPLFIIGCILSVFIEDHYRSTIRNLYTLFSKGNVTFAKDFHLFPSYTFIISFAILFTFIAFALIRKHIGLFYIALLVAMLMFGVVLVLTSYINTWGAIALCDMCRDNKRVLRGNDINYDATFLISSVAFYITFFAIYLLKVRPKLKSRN